MKAPYMPSGECAAGRTNRVDFRVRGGVAVAVDAVALGGNDNAVADDHGTKGFAAAFLEGGSP